MSVDQSASTEQQFSPGIRSGQSQGSLGNKNRGWRILYIEDIKFEGVTNNEFDTLLNAIDPTQDNEIQLPDNSGVVRIAIDASAYDDFADALTAAAGKTLLITTQVNITADTTIPATVHTIVENGGSFNITAAKTLTINGSFYAGLYQAFSGAGLVAWGDSSISCAYPEWFGAVGDGVTDDTTAMQAAIDSDPQLLMLNEGTYICNVTVDGRVNIKGTGPQSILKATTADPVITVESRITGSRMGRTFEEFVIDGNSGTSKGIYYYNTTGAAAIDAVEEQLNRIYFKDCTRGIDFGSGNLVIANSVRYCEFRDCDYGIYANTTGTDSINLNYLTENRFTGMNLCGIYFNGSCAANHFHENWLEASDGFGVILKSTLAPTGAGMKQRPNSFYGGWWEQLAQSASVTLDDEGVTTTYFLWTDDANVIADTLPSISNFEDSKIHVAYIEGTLDPINTPTFTGATTFEADTSVYNALGSSVSYGSATGEFCIRKPYTANVLGNRGFLVEGLPMSNKVDGYTNMCQISDLLAVSGATITEKTNLFIGSPVVEIDFSDSTERAQLGVTLTNGKYYAMSWSMKGASADEADIWWRVTGSGTLFNQKTILARGDRWTHYVAVVWAGATAPTSQTLMFSTDSTATFQLSRLQMVEFDTSAEAHAFVHNQNYAGDDTVETLTGAGAVSILTPITHLVTASGGVAADAITLADGYEGQEKTIIYKTETDVGDTSVLTPANFYDGTTITYDVAGQGTKLLFTNGSWRIIVNDGTVA